MIGNGMKSLGRLAPGGRNAVLDGYLRRSSQSFRPLSPLAPPGPTTLVHDGENYYILRKTHENENTGHGDQGYMAWHILFYLGLPE